MSSPSLDPVEEAIINASLNGQLLGNLLFGAYSAVYFYTLYMYTRKKSARNWLVIGGISLSYIAYLVQISIEWAFVKVALINHGETRLSTFLETFATHGPRGSFVYEVTLFVMAAVADALMIWRCYFIWNRSIRIILIPSFFLFCEIVLDLSIIGVLSRADFIQTHAAHNLLGSAIFVTFLTTLVSTVLIAYRVNALAKEEVSRGTRALIKHVLEILLQSAAAYCLVSLAAAISVTLATIVNDSLTMHTAVLYANQEYVINLWAFTAGIAPTIMVARIVIGPERDVVNSSTANMSGMQFHTHTLASQSATRMGTEGMMGNGSGHSLDPKDLESKEEGMIRIA
ncbi:hypothetical protein CPB84DRAFT_1962005 [Gymnopilus junonius]|uniref:Uncharacterized protein n=1 Tax=Gymnopilus junonius TaxID=109634 RepID=A0A9P5NLP7_GYMJU|nr:hypothetical protein CPB84DRAFT_1962005 [Gymnopilus junonius]